MLPWSSVFVDAWRLQLTESFLGKKKYRQSCRLARHLFPSSGVVGQARPHHQDVVGNLFLAGCYRIYGCCLMLPCMGAASCSRDAWLTWQHPFSDPVSCLCFAICCCVLMCTSVGGTALQYDCTIGSLWLPCNSGTACRVATLSPQCHTAWCASRQRRNARRVYSCLALGAGVLPHDRPCTCRNVLHHADTVAAV